jgi:hypothetical protein
LNQLQSLLQNLSDKEMEKLNSLRLIGKEKVVFDYTRKFKTVELPPLDQITEQLKIKDAHYYKINSVLLRKCYKILEPLENGELLQFLKKKNLFSLLRHEILFQDKKKTVGKDEKNIEKFYLLCFHYLIDLPYKYYDKKLTATFGNKYLAAKGNSESDKLYIKFHTLFSDLNRIAAQKNPKKTIGITIHQLLEYEGALQNTQNHLAAYYLYRSICSYYAYYDHQPQKVIEYIEKAITLKDQIADFFPIDINVFLQLLYAEALFTNNRLGEAEKIYHQVFEAGVDETIYGYYYHCEQYALVSIALKKYEQAKKILDTVFEPCIENRLDIYATRGAMCYAKLYLSKDELKSALHYLNIAKMINEKIFYLPFDVQLRVLENFYFFLKKDYDFAFQLANRNIKFLKAQEQTDIFENYLILWRLIIGLITSISKNNPVSKALEEDYDFLKNKFVNLYCGLIEKVYLSV